MVSPGLAKADFPAYLVQNGDVSVQAAGDKINAKANDKYEVSMPEAGVTVVRAKDNSYYLRMNVLNGRAEIGEAWAKQEKNHVILERNRFSQVNMADHKIARVMFCNQLEGTFSSNAFGFSGLQSRDLTLNDCSLVDERFCAGLKNRFNQSGVGVKKISSLSQLRNEVNSCSALTESLAKEIAPNDDSFKKMNGGKEQMLGYLDQVGRALIAHKFLKAQDEIRGSLGRGLNTSPMARIARSLRGFGDAIELCERLGAELSNAPAAPVSGSPATAPKTPERDAE